MAAKTSAKLGAKRKSSSEPTIKNARALRYDNLSSVLLKIDEQTHGPANPNATGPGANIRHRLRSYALRWCL